VSEIRGISDHPGGFLLRRGCPGEKVWFLPRSTPAVGSLTRFVPQLQTPPGLTTSPQASLPACPAVGLSTSNILSDGSGDIEPPRRRAILPRPEGQGSTRHLVMTPLRRRVIACQYLKSVPIYLPADSSANGSAARILFSGQRRRDGERCVFFEKFTFVSFATNSTRDHNLESCARKTAW
jgi:hypothetical protein